MWSYGVKGSLAGKTGTTNDNSDAWFIGYTPQLLCGVWSGCDDRFIRFSNTTNGQGASAALPVWGYFYNEVERDKTLPYSDTADFAKPAVDINEPNYDYINNTQVDLGAQGMTLAAGSHQITNRVLIIPILKILHRKAVRRICMMMIKHPQVKAKSL
jgi:penicillin-binding protein 1A